MQNNNGGWGAFDIHNDRLFLNKIPFSDMEALCDPSTADVTGRVLEAFGLLCQGTRKLPVNLVSDMSAACNRAVLYLNCTQESTGAWYGRWGANYIYGTSNVVCGLALFSKQENYKQIVAKCLGLAHAWLREIQNPDGGWGETLESYRKPELAGHGPSTASQTGWALMALLAHAQHNQKAIQSGMEYLLRTQAISDHAEETSWPESRYTGTGFPNHFFLGYSLYRHYFPMMALGRYAGMHSRA
ncbi:unnamed protein product [Penicillium nalgiovense]|nr:unnamed protein product [Penicillium nalgiovense]